MVGCRQLAEIRFEKSKTIYEEFEKMGLPASIVPHAPYSVSEELWELMIPYFAGKTISIHNQESPRRRFVFYGRQRRFYKNV